MFKEYNEYINHISKDKSVNTINNYKYSIESMLNYFHVDSIEVIKKLTENDFENYQQYLLSNIKGKNKNTIKASTNTYFRNIETFLIWLTNKDYLQLNPMRMIKGLKEINKEVKIFLTIDERDKMIASARNLNEKLMLAIMFFQGFRRNEVAELKKEDIDSSSDQIIVHGKGGKIVDQVLHPYVKGLFEQYLKISDNDSEYIFVSKKGFGHSGEYRQITPKSVGERVKAVARIANIDPKKVDKVTAHITRGSVACNMALSGATLPEIQSTLRHSSGRTTEIYLKPVMKELAKQGISSIPSPRI
jgi:site-specific recombinase XerD